MRVFWGALSVAAPAATAEWVYRHGVLYTLNEAQPKAEALAVSQGRIVFVGTDRDALQWIGAGTHIVDLQGRRMMPGLIDGHLHPLRGGSSLVKCNLGYARLTIPALQQKINACLSATPQATPDTWLEVVNWFRYSMQPKGVAIGHAVLDALPTSRPIYVSDSFGHSGLVNSRGLALIHVDEHTPDPVGGRIERTSHGAPTGILGDAARGPVKALLPRPTAADNIAAARAAEQALNRQGVTSFLDAVAEPEDIEAFTALAKRGELTVRAHFAPLIKPADAQTEAGAKSAAQRVIELAHRLDQGSLTPRPSITVRNVKLFMDGVITAPANTGALVEPYLENRGTLAEPNWVPEAQNKPPVYFPAAVLPVILDALARAKIDPHLHTDGDGAVRAALDGIAAMRRANVGADVRPALAHCELVHPDDYARFAALNVTPVLSFQWGKPAPDTVEGARDTLGAERVRRIEPAGVLAAQGARIAFGSDWPVDRLDEWFALKVGVTRSAAPYADRDHAGRLGADPGLSREAVLRAATINAAYEMHQQTQTGSLQAGKFADFILLDRDVLAVPAEEIAAVRVVLTVVGGQVVYDMGLVDPHPPNAR